MFYKQELINLDGDTKEARLAVKIAGESLVPESLVLTRITISDATQEGKDLIERFLKMGWRVESVKD